jgi:hypothetical protein
MEEVKTKKTWGGAREGAGRPAPEGRKVTLTIRVPKDVAEILADKENKSAYITECIRKMSREKDLSFY